ncbi:unnamed protein product [marine sediment metagenome]|uniref:Uncharacterized protein n=1 Tax=marine sediment metagenome TaxID=412755 RepID=X1D296_9ZZZZ
MCLPIGKGTNVRFALPEQKVFSIHDAIGVEVSWREVKHMKYQVGCVIRIIHLTVKGSVVDYTILFPQHNAAGKVFVLSEDGHEAAEFQYLLRTFCANLHRCRARPARR